MKTLLIGSVVALVAIVVIDYAMSRKSTVEARLDGEKIRASMVDKAVEAGGVAIRSPTGVVLAVELPPTATGVAPVRAIVPGSDVFSDGIIRS